MSISWYLNRSKSCASGDYVFIFSVSFITSDRFKEPLINYVMSLAHRLHRNQGVTLTACARLVKSCTKSRRTSDAECGSACEPQRASPEAHIYRVALLAKDLGHLLRSASSSCTLQDSQRYDIINQRFPRTANCPGLSDHVQYSTDQS